MNLSQCPEQEQFQELLADRLSAEEERSLSQHLKDCQDCQQRMDELIGQTRFLQDVQQRLSHSGERQTPDLASVVDRFQAELETNIEQTWVKQGSSVEIFPENTQSEDSLVGRIDDIDLIAELGRGGMGVVYRGYERSLRRTVAVKTLARRLASSDIACERFIREAQSLAAVRHRHIVSIFRIVFPETDGGQGAVPCLVMEYVDGISLEQRLRQQGAMPLRDVVRTGIEIASALASAHERDIIHRDIKPGNILLEGETGLARITDFGLARSVDDVKLTQSGALVGTPGYMSPEQAEGLQVDSRSDLFSLGSVLYAMLAGRPPFHSSSTMKTLGRVLQGDVIPIESLRKDTPRWLAELVARLHARNPADRIQTAEEVIQLLLEGRAQLKLQPQAGPENFPTPLDGETTAVEIPKPAPPVSGKKRWLVPAGLAALCVAVFGLELAGVTRFLGSEVVSTTSLPLNSRTVTPGIDDSRELFVVLVDGQPVPGHYESLGAAVQAAPEDAVIELRTDGPVVTPCLIISQDQLTIRAGAGFCPRIMPGPELSGDERALLDTTGVLRLEGLALSVSPDPVSGLQANDLHVVQCREGRLQMLNCRLELQGTGACLNLDRASSSHVENCELLSANGPGIEWKPAIDASLTVRNTLCIGEVGFAVHHQTENAGLPRLQIQRCLLATRHGLKLLVPPEASVAMDRGNPVEVSCRYSVLDVEESVLRVGLSESGRPIRTENMAMRIRSALLWRDDWTWFGASQRMQFFSCPRKFRLPNAPVDRRAWQQFWGMSSSTRSIQEQIRFQSDRPQTKRPPYPPDLAWQYAVDVLLPPAAASNAMGIDPRIVGPGEGYLQWTGNSE